MAIRVWLIVGIALFSLSMVTLFIAPLFYSFMTLFNGLAPTVLSEPTSHSAWDTFSAIVPFEFSAILALGGIIIIGWGYLTSVTDEGESYEY